MVVGGKDLDLRCEMELVGASQRFAPAILMEHPR